MGDELNIDFSVAEFKKFGGETISDLGQYVLDYVTRVGENVKVMIGCDSKQRRKRTHFALVVVLYDDVMAKGAHYVFMRHKTKKIRDISFRLYQEAAFTLELGMYLDEYLKGKYTVEFAPNDYDGSKPIRLVEAHVDVNPNFGNGRNKSHNVYSAVMGLMCGYGFKTRGKPEAYAASCAADLICNR